VRLLLGLRALLGVLPGSGAQRQERWRRLRSLASRELTMRDVIAGGFVLLDEDPPRELVLGAVGAFWRLSGGVCAIDATTFREPQPAGTARAAWNFHLVRRPGGACILSTETRVRCADAASRRRFRIYWLVVRPGSGLIRRLMLRSIRRAAEG
jgi:hypothetical protein